jgi:hypothetical protein
MEKHIKRSILLSTALVALVLSITLLTYTTWPAGSESAVLELSLAQEETARFSPEGFVLDVARMIVRAIMPVQ